MAAGGVNVVLCIVVAILVLLIIAMNIYILVYFQNEEDKNTAIFPKIITVFTFTIICISVLMMPMDVANSRTKEANQPGIPMGVLWQIVYITMAVLAFVVPFAFFYYEAEDPDSNSNGKQIKAALKWDAIWILCFFIPTFLLWLFVGYVEVPVIKYTSSLQEYIEGSVFPVGVIFQLRGQKITYRISFVLYLISMIAFVGTFILIFFGGVGLAALPMDLINAYRKRPKQMSATKYAELKIMIGKRASMLLERGKTLKAKYQRQGSTRPKARRDIRDFNKFRTGVYIVEQEYKELEKRFNRGAGPRVLYIIWDYLQLVLGVIGVGLSITWLLHIILYMAPQTKPFSLFLNRMFIDMDSVFGLFGTIAYGIWTFYLLWCVIKGNFKVGVRIPLFCTIHPMKVGETMMNAFLFNAFILLLGSVAVVKFCSAAFKAYASYTAIDIIFNVGVQNLRGIKYFWYYYYWGMVAVAIITTIYLFILPSDKKAAQVDIRLEDLP